MVQISKESLTFEKKLTLNIVTELKNVKKKLDVSEYAHFIEESTKVENVGLRIFFKNCQSCALKKFEFCTRSLEMVNREE